MHAGSSESPVLTQSAIVRAAGYALLARALAYPDAANFAALNEVAHIGQDALADTVLSTLRTRASEAERDRLQAEFLPLLSVTSSPDCPTFETAFLSTDPSQQTERMADIAGFYRAFGVDPATPGFRPDDISVELEFMGFLCGKEAHAAEHLGEPRVRQVRRAQRLFLKDHLARWGGPLGRRMALRAPMGTFYQVAGDALDAWIETDCRLLRTGPVERVDEPAMTWEPPGGESTSLEDNPDLISPDEIPVL